MINYMCMKHICQDKVKIENYLFLCTIVVNGCKCYYFFVCVCTINTIRYE